MATFILKGKKITINDDIVEFLKKRYFDLGEEDLKMFLSSTMTKGDPQNGFYRPNLDETIQQLSEEQLSYLIETGASYQIRGMK